MKRKDFIYTISGVWFAMSGLKFFKSFTGDLEEQFAGIPVLFIGHGSTMNCIAINEFSLQ